MSKKRREADCRCGSKKKYKKCCMIKALPRAAKGNWVLASAPLELKEDPLWQETRRCKVWQKENWER